MTRLWELSRSSASYRGGAVAGGDHGGESTSVRIRGVVTDPIEAMIPGVTVLAISDALMAGRVPRSPVPRGFIGFLRCRRALRCRRPHAGIQSVQWETWGKVG